MSGAGEERGREEGITGGMEERKGRFGYTNKDGARVGGRGDRALLGKIQAFPSKVGIRHGKKKGGGRKGGRAERRVGMEDGQSLGKRENRHGGSQKEEV